jgi:predicted membrane protein
MSWDNQTNRKTSSSVFFGIFLAALGVLIFLDQVNLINFEAKFWPLFLIGVGIFSGIKNGFLRVVPFATILWGVLLMAPKFTILGVSSDRLVWPLFLIVGGIFIVMRSKARADRFESLRRERSAAMNQPRVLNPDPSAPDPVLSESLNAGANSQQLNIEAIFGGRKEIVTSKEFIGCNATAICGGVEINLMQADSTVQPMVVDLRVIFGGVELIVPSHWEVINETDVIFGGIEDKRHLRTSPDLQNAKQLILRGSVSFGGLELKSY